ncbi:MAG: RNA polymerase sigma factor [Bacteroidia bacterium]|nr:RNA polymerase sigma factor [Bacteroidia bacterium]MCF8427463.1 RNA polymerase sigma factor [Bacteroidia bacterium]
MDQTEKNIRFMTLYRPLHARLSRYVQSLIWQSEDAKDLVSEVTLEAFERFETLRQPEQFAYFLFAIARNLYLKKVRRQKFHAPWNREKMEDLDGGETSEDSLQRRELANLLGKLKPQQQEAITLFEVAGFKYEEIAQIQKVSLSKVKTDIYQARQRLKDLVELENARLKKFGLNQTINEGGLK